jgi:hypothetical protein
MQSTKALFNPKQDLKGTKTRMDMAAEFNIDIRTFRRWCDREKKRNPNFYLPPGPLPPKYQKVVYMAFGYPPCVDRSLYEWIY